MIYTFACKHTEGLFAGKRHKLLPADLQSRALAKLQRIHFAEDLGDLRVPPSNRLELLRGNRKGQYSIRINDQWRICFVWQENAAFNVEIVDYH